MVESGATFLSRKPLLRHLWDLHFHSVVLKANQTEFPKTFLAFPWWLRLNIFSWMFVFSFFCFPFHELIDHLYFFFGRVSVQMLGISISWMPFSISFPLFLVCWVFLFRKDDVGLFFFPFLKSIMMRYFAFFFSKIILFIYFWLCWVFTALVTFL